MWLRLHFVYLGIQNSFVGLGRLRGFWASEILGFSNGRQLHLEFLSVQGLGSEACYPVGPIIMGVAWLMHGQMSQGTGRPVGLPNLIEQILNL